MKFLLSLFLTFLSFLAFTTTQVQAIYNPLSVPNNKYGIHLIQPTTEEASGAGELVNSSGGDWGYITVVIDSQDKDRPKWQQFFNELRKRHIIPIIRIASYPQGDTWRKPIPGEEVERAQFLDSLIWPTKNRYVSFYNEPNHATEWGGRVNPAEYAQALDRSITAFKNTNPDFFVLNAGFDASAPNQLPNYMDQEKFMEEMDKAVPGIFNKLDGWASHSYPNPNFSGKPDSTGRGTVRTWEWEMDLLRNKFKVDRNLPIFITETGWKHQGGIKPNNSLLSDDTVADYYKEAFEKAWTSDLIVAIAPFLLDYQQELFDHFSFRKVNNGDGIFYYPQYKAVQQLSKIKGQPIQEYGASLVSGTVYSSLVTEENYVIPFKFKNTGQSIWNEYQPIRLSPAGSSSELGLKDLEIPTHIKIEPGQEYTFNVSFKAPPGGQYNVNLTLFHGDEKFDSQSFAFTTEVKNPVIIQTKSSLKWKKMFGGEYLIGVVGALNNSINNTMFRVLVGNDGISEEIEARNLIPDYAYEFTLEKPYYKPKTIRQVVRSGNNQIDFGELQPDFRSAILNPQEFWKLLPFSN